MKVRFRKGSFRLRISPSDLDALLQGVPASETVEMPGGSWEVVLVAGAETAIVAQAGTVTATLAATDVQRLAAAENEGVYFRTESPAPLDWFVEKDFPCVHPRAPGVREASEETFAPPPRFAERHGKGCT
jgi:hypothetical protein